MAATLSVDAQQPDGDDDSASEENEDKEIIDPCLTDEGTDENISQGIPLETIVNMHRPVSYIKNMEDIQNKDFIFMISPFKYDPLHPERRPTANYIQNRRGNRSDVDHVLMPYSKFNVTKNKKSVWLFNREALVILKTMCDNHTATFNDFKGAIRKCMHHHCELGSLEKLINQVYSNEERGHFMSIVLSNICNLSLDVDKICGQSPPLLCSGSNRSVTMSQEQVASLLACSVFCLYPMRSEQKAKNKYRNFPNPNFNLLYKSGHPRKIQKLKCIFHYFRRVTENMPTGVITIQRAVLPKAHFPRWSEVKTDLCDLHLTTGQKIEDVPSVLQVDFANKYIGGGVLSAGCVQEEIRFCICPEMLVSLLMCEKMEPNECIFLIGCERYSSYIGYADSFQYGGNYDDNTPKDNWGRKWCHVVAMDAIYFRHASAQYDMHCVDRELLKAYTSFIPSRYGSDYTSGIATGNWGCGAFNGDKYLKAIIQLMAASAAGRPLIYAAYRDKVLINSFYIVYEFLKDQKATVSDCYRYLQRYFSQGKRQSLFDYILDTPVSSLKS
ncbi:unnamed protein product [Rotaria socialis]|uniref:poly(ADP-ribose) glycohydrolase n=2 Tax=Rotaria socialis TaxID=392032 RepID=A0A818E9U0_9BILA|nr:unnamed protein product [Rotaria socialis]CAF4510424.1 unnamed protein product [Rotaria socialis]